MKKFLLSTVVLCLMASLSFAQSDKYMAAMGKNLQMSDSAFAHPAQLLTLSNSFERIAIAEKDQWLPYYYAALFQVNYGFMQGEDMSGGDAIAEKAEKLLMKADSLSPKNSEITTVKSMIATVRMLVNPYQRYMQYGMIVDTELSKAMLEDPTNPRPYYLKGQNLKNTPAQFGGGCETASKLLNTAKEKYATFKPASPIAPNWGKERTDAMIQECAGK